jgi:hypothetical protein
MAYSECFQCESTFETINATSGGFCTLACEEQFMLETSAEIERAKQDGLIDSEGEAILTEQAPSSDLQAAEDFLLSKFNIKVKS